MKYKVLEKQDIQQMKYFIDDENTQYDEVLLDRFLEEKMPMALLLKITILQLVLPMGMYWLDRMD